jgi:hypothetical protein
MRIEVKHPAFKSQRLSVETSSLLAGPKLLLNGAIVKRQKGRYPVVSDSGAQMLIQMRYNLIDPVPAFTIGEDALKLVEPFRWYEYVWSGLPILLVYAGGALGGLVGGVATMANGRIFRSERRSIAKYGLAGLTTVSAVGVFFALAIAIRLAIGANK